MMLFLKSLIFKTGPIAMIYVESLVSFPSGNLS